ncbi:helix-turn-helix transcriptional regulator [Streptomyces sp. 35G-GA-8]|uniref:helix-turn-helix domain-containing protein n=1 Tax=Streptomyces sp. 35G-GA-8 TaxID=2939434 RepID=UPI00201E8BF7|nr:helix-turn-helix transcriptional regulator [Streptomyces sp. 35G-GA-8]MCL7378746.1 helix-turn-helix domain-containing protein [Streptomyces sp. 35G-GA-8]
MELNNESDKLTPRLRLGKRVRRLRERKGLSIRQLSEQVGGYSHSYLGRVELGDQLPSEALVKSLDKFFDTDGVLADMLEMAHDSSIPDYGRVVVTKEVEAERIQVFTSSLIPGLLQTEEYARELFRTSLPGSSEGRVNDLVAVRMGRKGIFDRAEPLLYWAIIDEAALKRPMKGAKLMSRQLNHLLKAAERFHSTIQVLPFSEGAHPMLGGCLTLLTLRDGGMMAFVESFKSGETVELPKRLIELTQCFDVARSLALPEDKSLNLIRRYLREYENEDDS